MLAAALVVGLASPGQAQVDEACKGPYERGQELRLAGELPRARGELERCVALCPDVLARECREWIDEIAASLVRLTVDVVDAEDRLLSPTSLLVDGEPMPLELPRLELAPGPHRIEVAVGSRTGRRDVDLEPGAHRVRIRVGEGSGESEETTSPSSSATWWALGGTGVALVAVGAVLLGVGHAKNGRDEAFCRDRAGCTQEEADERAAATTRLWASGGVLTGVGGVLAGIGVVGLVVSSGGDDRATEVSVRPELGGASMAVSVPF